MKKLNPVVNPMGFFTALYSQVGRKGFFTALPEGHKEREKAKAFPLFSGAFVRTRPQSAFRIGQPATKTP